MEHWSFPRFRFHVPPERIVQLVRAGRRMLERYGQTDCLGKRAVYLRHNHCYSSIIAVDWDWPFADPGSGLFFWGWFRPARWWSRFCYWDWEIPSWPAGVTPANCDRLRAPDVTEWRMVRVLDILWHSELISPQEFNCATLLGASR